VDVDSPNSSTSTRSASIPTTAASTGPR
jgi:hypothetical protein